PLGVKINVPLMKQMQSSGSVGVQGPPFRAFAVLTPPSRENVAPANIPLMAKILRRVRRMLSLDITSPPLSSCRPFIGTSRSIVQTITIQNDAGATSYYSNVLRIIATCRVVFALLELTVIVTVGLEAIDFCGVLPALSSEFPWVR